MATATVVAGHVLPSVALLGESLATLLTTEWLDVEVNYLEVPVVLGLASLPVEHPCTHVTPPLHHCGGGTYIKGRTHLLFPVNGVEPILQ